MNGTTKPRPLYGVAGIDEAGRGPMIGPMVVCGVLLAPTSVGRLSSMGVRDSKTMTPSRRSSLAPLIKSVADRVVVKVISASRIDEAKVHGTNLNELEVMAFAEVVRSLRPKVVYMDAADVDAARFRDRVRQASGLGDTACSFIAEHKADSKYAIVAAASIVAKVERDRLIKVLHEEYGDFGSGYPADPKSVEFIRAVLSEGRDLPPIVRRSWASVQRVLDELEQGRLV